MSFDKQLRIVITGASSGIGEAIALDLAKNGHKFFLTGRNKGRLQKVANKVAEKGGIAYYGVGDVGNTDVVESHYTQALSHLGGIDVLIANAGVGYFGYLEDITIEQFDEQFSTNVRGVFLWLRKVVPLMRQQNRGQIIVTSSNLGLEVRPKASIYCATKHAVQAMVRALREELKGTMVKAATINPGAVATPWFEGRNVDRSKMLQVSDVVKAVRLIIEQSETSDIDHILLLPGRK